MWLSRDPAPDGPAPTPDSALFHGAGDASPGWLVRCLSEFAFRGVNLTASSRGPCAPGSGTGCSHLDCAGGAGEAPVAGARGGAAPHCEAVRVLGTFAAAGATMPSGHEGPDTT